MSIDNLIRMNDWDNKKLITTVLFIQLAMWGLIGLDQFNYHLPVVRQLLGFIYLTYIPGIIFLRILKLHKIGTIEVLLYSVGLSIAFTMFAGALVNQIFIILGIPGPVSLVPVTAVLSFMILAMCTFCYFMRKGTTDNTNIEINDVHKDIPFIPVIALSIIPIISIIGAYLVRFNSNNILLMLLIIIISITIFLVTLKSNNLSGLYPYVLFIISISLLFHTSLISPYLQSWDVHIEYHLANNVLINSLWSNDIFSTTNSMLSVVMLGPIYSIMLNLELTWVYKIIYPLIFSLVPIGLYKIYQRQTSDVIAFLSCTFFISFFMFYTQLLAVTRQMVAELFFVLLILLIISNEMELRKRVVLFAVFSASIIVSHYGLSYFYLSFVIAAWLIDKIVQFLIDLWNRLKHNIANPVKKANIITLPYIVLFILFMLIWYTYTSLSSNIVTITWVLDNIIKNATDILNPSSAEGLELILTSDLTFIHSIAKYYHLLSQELIVVGLAATVIYIGKTKFNAQYLYMSFIGFLFCILGIVVPFFASSLNTGRLYHIALFLLSPFCIIGLLYLIETTTKFTHTIRHRALQFNVSVKLLIFIIVYLLLNVGFIYELLNDDPISASLILLSPFCIIGLLYLIETTTKFNANVILSIFVIVYLLFNVGFIYELLNDNPISASLSQENIKKFGTMESKSEVLYNEVNTFDQDISSINWCKHSLDFKLHQFYTDINTLHPCISYGMILGPDIVEWENIIPENASEIDPGSYLLFGYPSVKGDVVRIGFSKTINMSDALEYVPTNKIYDNGGGEVYMAL